MHVDRLLLLILLFNIVQPSVTSLFQEQQCSHIYPRNASNIILFFVNLHSKSSTSNETCGGGELQDMFISDLLQIYYTIDQINADLARTGNTINGSIGVRICDVCGDAVLQTILLAENVEYIKKTIQKSLVGIITATDSTSVAHLSSTLVQFNLDIPIVTYTATERNLTSIHKNIIQVVPDDSLQSRALVQLIKQMQCNYITLFSNENIYSKDLRDSISSFIKISQLNDEAPICINKYVEYDYTEETSADLDKHLQSILSLYENEINKEDPVIVYLGYTVTYLELVKRINVSLANYPRINNIHLISSEAASIGDQMVLRLDNKIKLYRLSFNKIDINAYTSLLEYYNRTLETYSSGDDHIPWLSEYIKKKYNCSLNAAGVSEAAICDLTKIERKLPNSQYLPYLIYSIVGFYEQLKSTYVFVCRDNPGLDNCPELSTNNGLKILTSNLRNMNLYFEYYPLVFEGVRISTTIRNGRFQVTDQTVYKIEIKDGTNRTSISYTNQQWSEEVVLKQENCCCKHVCLSCLPRPEFVIEQGDLYFMSVMSQNKNEMNTKCSESTTENDYLWWISFQQAMDILKTSYKNELNYISRLDIGTIMINDCDIPEYAYYNLLTIENNYSDLYESTIALIGASASGITDSILRYTTNENIITISAVSSSPALTNRTNFCRVVPDDNDQVRVINRIMQAFSWNSAIFLYSNSNYGLNALAAFKSNNPNIYLFDKMFDWNFTDVVRFVERTTQTDVLIMFANPDDIESYFRAMKEVNSTTKKFYIGSDFWATNEETIIENWKYYLGSIVIKFGEEEDSITIGNYISDKYSKMKNSNESFYADQYFNKRFRCNRANSFSNFHQPYRVCDSNYFSSIASSFKSDASRKDFMNIAYALLLSYNTYLQQKCASNDKATLIECLKMARNATIIKPFLQNLTIPIDFRNNQNIKLFDSVTCNAFNIKYTIDTIVKSGNGIRYTKLAVYDNGVFKNTLDIKKLRFFTLNGTEVDGTSINGYFSPLLVTTPPPVIPELQKCEKENSKMDKIIAGVAVALALISSGLFGAAFYFVLKLFKNKREYSKAYKESRKHDGDYEIISIGHSPKQGIRINARLRDILNMIPLKKKSIVSSNMVLNNGTTEYQENPTEVKAASN